MDRIAETNAVAQCVAWRLSQDWSGTMCMGRDAECDAAEHLAACTMADVVDPRRYIETLYGARRLATSHLLRSDRA